MYKVSLAFVILSSFTGANGETKQPTIFNPKTQDIQKGKEEVPDKNQKRKLQFPSFDDIDISVSVSVDLDDLGDIDVDFCAGCNNYIGNCAICQNLETDDTGNTNTDSTTSNNDTDIDDNTEVNCEECDEFVGECSFCGEFPDDGFNYTTCNTTEPYLVGNGECDILYNSSECNLDGKDCEEENDDDDNDIPVIFDLFFGIFDFDFDANFVFDFSGLVAACIVLPTLFFLIFLLLFLIPSLMMAALSPVFIFFGVICSPCIALSMIIVIVLYLVQCIIEAVMSAIGIEEDELNAILSLIECVIGVAMSVIGIEESEPKGNVTLALAQLIQNSTLFH